MIRDYQVSSNREYSNRNKHHYLARSYHSNYMIWPFLHQITISNILRIIISLKAKDDTDICAYME